MTMAAQQPPDHLTTAHGLTTAEAHTRLAKEGPNEVAKGRRRSVWRRLVDTLRQPMFALLVAAALFPAVSGRSRTLAATP